MKAFHLNAITIKNGSDGNGELISIIPVFESYIMMSEIGLNIKVILIKFKRRKFKPYIHFFPLPIFN